MNNVRRGLSAESSSGILNSLWRWKFLLHFKSSKKCKFLAEPFAFHHIYSLNEFCLQNLLREIHFRYLLSLSLLWCCREMKIERLFKMSKLAQWIIYSSLRNLFVLYPSTLPFRFLPLLKMSFMVERYFRGRTMN